MTDKRNCAGTGTGRDRARPDEPRKRARNGLDERWLEKKIHDMYQEVVNEPVPDDILKILNRIPKMS
jgi:hypothetical protein